MPVFFGFGKFKFGFSSRPCPSDPSVSATMTATN